MRTRKAKQWTDNATPMRKAAWWMDAATVDRPKPGGLVASKKSDQTPEPGEFPLDALNPTIRTMVEESAETYQIDPALPAMAGVATLAGAIGKRIVVTGATSGRRTHLNVYVIPGAPKSYGKNAA